MKGSAKSIGSKYQSPFEALRGWTLKIGLVAGIALATALVLSSSSYVANVAGLALTFVILATSFNLIYGYTGLVSLAQAGFWGIGAYTGALLVVDLGFSHWLAFLLAGLVAVVFALIVGIPSLRLSVGGFAIVTLIFSLLLALVAGNWRSLTRGRLGIPGLPPPLLRVSDAVFDLSQPKPYFVATLLLALVTLLIIHRLLRSRVGRTLTAIRENATLATSQGINTFYYRLFVFCLAAFFSGVIGAFYVFHLTIVHPSIFDFYYMQTMLIMVIVGGPGTFWPVVVAALLFTAVPEGLRVAEDLRLIVYGILLVLAMIFLPEGVGGFLKRRLMVAPADEEADER